MPEAMMRSKEGLSVGLSFFMPKNLVASTTFLGASLEREGGDFYNKSYILVIRVLYSGAPCRWRVWCDVCVKFCLKKQHVTRHFLKMKQTSRQMRHTLS